MLMLVTGMQCPELLSEMGVNFLSNLAKASCEISALIPGECGLHGLHGVVGHELDTVAAVKRTGNR